MHSPGFILFFTKKVQYRVDKKNIERTDGPTAFFKKRIIIFMYLF